MANLAGVGAQWGDEGKGRFVDFLASRAGVVVRYQGGNNAGHTVGDREGAVQAASDSLRDIQSPRAEHPGARNRRRSGGAGG
jgi:hypothetical protein